MLSHMFIYEKSVKSHIQTVKPINMLMVILELSNTFKETVHPQQKFCHYLLNLISFKPCRAGFLTYLEKCFGVICAHNKLIMDQWCFGPH